MATELNSLSRLFRAHQSTDMNEKCSSSLPYYTHLLNFENSPNSFSESWPNATHRKQDDELQSLDWLLARPCLPKLPPLDADESSHYHKYMQNAAFSCSSAFTQNISFQYNNDSFGKSIGFDSITTPMPGNYYHSTDRNMEKPALSYSNLIFLAILSSPRQAMTVNQIYQWCEKTFPYYQDKTCGWKNSLRHNLSLNKGFQKLPKANGESGRGALWVIDPNQYQCMLDAVRKNPICMEILRQQQQQMQMMDQHSGLRDVLCHEVCDDRMSLAFHAAVSSARRNGMLLKNGWADVADGSFHHLSWRVVPQNAHMGLVMSEEEDRDFQSMVDKMHYTKEQIMAYEKLTEEEREGIPSIETCPKLFKEMVTMKVQKKSGKKRRRRTANTCVSFRAAPCLDHHYASHQMLLSHKANCMPCLQERAHADMLWFGPEPLESQLFDDISDDAQMQEEEDISPKSQRLMKDGKKMRNTRRSSEYCETTTAADSSDVEPMKEVRFVRNRNRRSFSTKNAISTKKHKKYKSAKAIHEKSMSEEEEASDYVNSLSALSAARLLLDVTKYRSHAHMLQDAKVSDKSCDFNKRASRSRRKAPIFQRSMSPEEEEGGRSSANTKFLGSRLRCLRKSARDFKPSMKAPFSKKRRLAAPSSVAKGVSKLRRQQADLNSNNHDVDSDESLTEITSSSLVQLMRSQTDAAYLASNVTMLACDQEIRNFKKLFRFQDSDESLSPTKLNVNGNQTNAKAILKDE